MAKKVSLDQTTAWIIAVTFSVTVFAGGYALLKRVGKNQGGSTDHFNVQEMEDPDGAKEKSGHDEEAKEGAEEHSVDHHDGGGAEDKESQGQSAHGAKADDGHGDSHSGSKKNDSSKHGESSHNDPHKASDSAEKNAGPKHDVHWAYEGENGPAMWGKLSPNFVDCQDGRSQSPINFESPQTQRDLRPLKFSYISSETKLENNGHTIGPKFDTGNYVTFNGGRYGLVGFHFHIPSEHTVGGVPYEMELHLVHKNEHGNLAVVGLFIEEGDHPNPLLEKIWAGLPAKAGSSGPEMMIDPKDFLPEDTSYFAYKGSLTTPPCSEGVQWLVVKKSIKASSKQIDAFARIYHNNARPPQPLYGRMIMKSASH